MARDLMLPPKGQPEYTLHDWEVGRRADGSDGIMVFLDFFPESETKDSPSRQAIALHFPSQHKAQDIFQKIAAEIEQAGWKPFLQ